MISEISFLLTRKELILRLVIYTNCGIVLPLFIGVHLDAKKSLKRFAFTQNSEINFLLASKGGIDGIFLLHKIGFNFDQYVLGGVLGFLILIVVLSM